MPYFSWHDYTGITQGFKIVSFQTEIPWISPSLPIKKFLSGGIFNFNQTVIKVIAFLKYI
jgi:hypothetical protein